MSSVILQNDSSVSAPNDPAPANNGMSNTGPRSLADRLRSMALPFHWFRRQKSDITYEQIVVKFESATMNLVNAQKDKFEFVKTLNHEFRSPLQVIKGYSQYLTRGMAGRLSPR